MEAGYGPTRAGGGFPKLQNWPKKCRPSEQFTVREMHVIGGHMNQKGNARSKWGAVE